MWTVRLGVSGHKDLVLVEGVCLKDATSVESVALALGTALVSAGHAVTDASLVGLYKEGWCPSNTQWAKVVGALQLLRTGSVHVVVRVSGRDDDGKIFSHVANAISLIGCESLIRCLVRASKQLPEKLNCKSDGVRLSVSVFPTAQAQVYPGYRCQLRYFSERLKPILAHRCQGAA